MTVGFILQARSLLASCFMYKADGHRPPLQRATPMLIDSHAHLDDPRFDSDREAVLQRAWDAGIRTILTIGNGNGPDQMNCGIPLAEGHDWIYTSVGIHPHDASKV